MKNKKDVLLVARPDHSLQIYYALSTQSVISFHYLTYKVVRPWVKTLLRIKKLRTVSKNAICSIKLTFISLCRYTFHFRFAQNWDETSVFDSIEKRLFNKNDYRIIHYWPEYGDAEILNYIGNHPGSLAIADIHMPHPKTVFLKMAPVYEKSGINPNSTHLSFMSSEQNNLIDRATHILVPSSYVADTYKTLFPDKQYHVVPYGITVSQDYKKNYKKEVTSFVYAGRVSLEKGLDILLDYFKSHAMYQLHIYGTAPREQACLFESYRCCSNICFHDPVPKVELQNCLRCYDVGIHLSRFDAYSLAVGEMIGVGLPVIVSDQTGNKDDIVNEKLGIVIPLDSDSLSSAVLEITDVARYNAYIDSIDNYINTRYRPYGERVVDFYKSLLV